VFALLRQPDDATAVINGKTMSAGELRTGLRASLAKSGKPVPRVTVLKIAPAMRADRLARRHNQLLSKLRRKPSVEGSGSLKIAATVPFRGLDERRRRSARRDARRRGNAGSALPAERSIDGGTQSHADAGGVATFQARGLGANSGEVRLYREFANGLGSHVAAVTVPADLAGVLDQAASLQLIRSDGAVSNARKGSFIAWPETARMPASLISNTSCACSPQAWTASEADRWARRGDDSISNFSDLGGTDARQVKIGNGRAPRGGFRQPRRRRPDRGVRAGEPDAAAVKFRWSAPLISRTTERYEPFDMFIGEESTTYTAGYTCTVSTVGPAGVSPDPATKAQCTGKAGKHRPRDDSSAMTVRDVAGGKAAPAGAERVPDWGAIAASGGNTSGAAPAATPHPKEMPRLLDNAQAGRRGRNTALGTPAISTVSGTGK